MCIFIYKLNSDIISKPIKQIKVLGILDLKPNINSIYYVEFEFLDGTKTDLKLKKYYYQKYLQFVRG